MTYGRGPAAAPPPRRVAQAEGAQTSLRSWGVRYATRVKFLAPDGSDSRSSPPLGTSRDTFNSEGRHRHLHMKVPLLPSTFGLQ